MCRKAKRAIDWTSPPLRYAKNANIMLSDKGTPVICARWLADRFSWPAKTRKFWLRVTTAPQRGALRLTLEKSPAPAGYISVDGELHWAYRFVRIRCPNDKTTGYLWLEYE